MAVVENRATEDGDVLVIKTDVPVVGIVSLTAFTDSTVGETGSLYFEKTFRYSINGGLTFSEWLDLTTINIENIVIERVDYFIVEYRYKRIGAGGDLSFNNVDITGTITPLEYPVFNSMIFSEFFTPNNSLVLGWALNVLEKLYKNGIIPKYVVRNEGGDDKDFVSYWFSITHFFAILVYYARQFEDIINVPLMREFVKGRGIYMRDDPDIEELYYIYANYIAEIQKRGSKDIFSTSGEMDGELLRLLNYIASDEFLFAFTNRGELGWCIGESSPLYKGADNIVNLIKGYEFTEEVEDLSKYPLINSSYIGIINAATQIDGGLEKTYSKMVISNVPDGEIAGIGVSTNILSGGGGVLYYGDGIGVDLIYPEQLSEDAIVIDPTLDYEISFRVTKSDKYVSDLSFGVALFDINGVVVAPVRITDGVADDRFFTVQTLNQEDSVEYWVRGVLHACSASLIPEDVLTVGFGQNLRAPANAKYLIPIIIVENNTGWVLTDIVRIRDVKVRPASLWFSRGLLSARNFIIGYLKNNSSSYNNRQVEKIIDEELIPYNTFTLLKFI